MPATALLLACLLQCPDPPGSNFAFTELPPQTVTLSDGYQTFVQLRYPTPPPGPCGWPVLVLVHYWGADLANVGGLSAAFAKAGYLTVAYEVRGQGGSMGLNPGNGSRYYGVRERIDMKEVLDWVEANYPNLADMNRIGVTGISQGGILAWMAAAWSGLPFEPNPWNAGSFPVISAVVAEDVTPDLGDHGAPMDLGVMGFTAAMVMGVIPYAAGVDWWPPLRAQLQSAILNEDYATWSGALNDPLRDIVAKIPSITTAVMALIAHDDYHFPSDSLARAWSLLPASTPKKLYLGAAGAHKAPWNLYEVAFRSDWRAKWFDRWLKSLPNGIDQGPAIEYLVTPSDPAAYLDVATLWEHRRANAWPPAGTVSYALYPRQGGALSTSPPAGPEPDDAVVQTATPGLTMSTLSAGGFGLGVVFANVPFVWRDYETVPLSGPLKFVGTPNLHLEVRSPGTRYQVRAVLSDVDATGSPRYVCAGSGFVHDNAAAGPNALEIPFTTNAYTFEAGHRIRLSFWNLQIHTPPVGPDLRYLPYPEPFTFEVRHSAGAATRLDLPVQPTVVLDAQPISLSASAGGSSAISLDAGAVGAGAFHLVLLSLSGFSPGTPFGPGTLPLNFDALTFFALNFTNSFLFQNFLGTLSNAGTGNATLVLPAGLAPELAGSTVTAAALLLSPAYGSFPSANAVSIAIVP